MELSPQEIQLFRHNGFIRFPTQLSKDHVEALKAAALKDMEEVWNPLPGKTVELSEFLLFGSAVVSSKKRLLAAKSSIRWNHYWVRI